MTNNVRDGRYYLTGPQRRVLALLDDGWQACWIREGASTGAFIQRGRIGYGGQSENIRRDTLAVLVDRGLVQRVHATAASTHYGISPAGHAAVTNGWTPTRKAR